MLCRGSSSFSVWVHLSWIRVDGRLVRVSDQRDMDSQLVTVDQLASAIASVQEAIANLGQRIDGQQAR